MNIIDFDTETALTRPGVCAPELACVSVCVEDIAGVHPCEWPATIIGPAWGVKLMREALADPSIGFSGANVAFDFCVLMQHSPDIIPAVFAAYNANRVTDLIVRQKLLDIASDRMWKYKGQYSLAGVARRLAGWELEKGSDTWRLRYGELLDVPLESWDPEARAYPLNDARASRACRVAQEPHANLLDDQYRMTRRELWLCLCKSWGLRTRPEGVAAFTKQVMDEIERVQGELTTMGLVRSDGSRDTKATTQLMLSVCKERGIKPTPTDTIEKRMKVAKKEGIAYTWDPYTDPTGVCLDADTCRATEDPRLIAYADYSTQKQLLAKDIPILQRGAIEPVHTRFDIAETGRTTSSKPNIQNFAIAPGIRECFIPRPGWVFAQADFPGGELHTWAQVCLWLLGHSKMARVLNDNQDPHLEVAATIDGCSYADAKAKYKANKSWRPRLLAKVVNFGLPGGLGVDSLIAYAAGKKYNVHLTQSEARTLKNNWREAWPEATLYFEHVNLLCASGVNGRGVMKQLRSNRYRGGVSYTQCANSYFQGLLADVTSEAGWLISEAMYNPEALRAEYHCPASSPLYGSRMVNFPHDEYIAETPDNENASNVVLEMCRLMYVGANKWVPDVPFLPGTIEPCLMTHWSKDAETIIDTSGRVQVWRGKVKP